MAVTKSDLTKTIARSANVSQSQAGKVLDTVLASITDALTRGDEVRLTGFGTFRVVLSKERQGRNLRTGAPMTIPPRRRPTFSAGSQLVEAVRDSEGSSS